MKSQQNRRHFLKQIFFGIRALAFFSWQRAHAQIIPFTYWRQQTPPLTLWAFGANGYGQIGDNSLVNKSSPVQIGSLNTWAAADVGSLHGVATKSDGTLWTWGDNTNGNLGIGNRIGKSSPVQVGTLTNWSQVTACGMYTTAEHYNSLAIKIDNTLWAWGDNTNGQLGDGTVIARSSPVQIGALTTWSWVTGGGAFHSLAVKTDGTLWAWGNGAKGALGDNTVVSKSSPVQIGALNNWAKVSAGESHVVALKTDGTLWAWGANASGQLGDNTAIAKSSPVQIGSLTTWTAISAGGDRSYALKSDNTLWAWGDNGYGALGIGNRVGKSSPVQVGSAEWQFVEAGHTHVVCIKTDGTLWTVGQNDQGQLGDGTVVSRSSLVQIGSITWSKASAGESFTMALK